MNRIIVTRNNVKIGILTEDNKSITFSYSDNIESKNFVPGLNKPLNISSKLFPIFENMLPEYEQLEVLKAKYHIKNNIGVLLYLDNIHGTYDFYSIDDYVEQKVDPDDGFVWHDNIDEILQSNYTFPNILNYTLDIPDEKLHPREFKNNKLTGLSGFQYKFGVEIDDTNKTVSSTGSNSSEFIMKPYNKGYATFKPNNKDATYLPYLLINEHIFMSIARDVGFKIPYNAIIKDGHDYHYVIKRYDRFKGRKIDHHEMLTLLNKHSDEKYKVSAVEALQKASEFLDDKEIREMFRFFIFSVIIAHGDFHAKNISLIYKTNFPGETNRQLAPLYDISTVGIYKDVNGVDIGMKIKNKKSNISKDDLIWLGSKILIEENEVIKFIEDLVDKFKNSFLDYVELLPKEIKSLPVFIDRYMRFKTFDVVLKKYYSTRILYIDRYLTDTGSKDKDIWS